MLKHLYVRALCGALLVAGLAFGSTAMAAAITGNITMSGHVSPTGGTDGWADATGLAFLNNEFTVGLTDGTFADLGLAGTGTINNFQFSPVLDPSPVAPLWSIGPASFTLTSISIDSQSAAGLTLSGTGIVSAVGYDDTTGYWSFSSQSTGQVGGYFSFSAGTFAVPEPGSLGLIGASLMAFGLIRRRRVA